MIFAILTKILSRSAEWSSSSVEMFSYEREAGWYIDKVCYVAMNEKKAYSYPLRF